MIATALQWAREVHPLVLVAVLAWAMWAAAVLTGWTWAAIVVAIAVTAGPWRWAPAQVLDAAAAVALLGYLVECTIDDRADCWWCHGSPKRRNSRHFFHFCLFCGGKGHRVRLGARLLPRHRKSSDT